ncbi:MAG: hypothetical protein LBU80_04675 [Rikenellaceae bacterium]|jgi:hypothetical protein|nr:hypothetical protein [Rikenellaceae bacterium]
MFKKIIVLIPAFLLAAASAPAQNGSVNTFNPYTFYGLGDLENPGTAINRSMGGIGVAMNNSFDINVINPAAYGNIPQKSFLFDFGLSGRNDFLKTAAKSTVHNNFDISDIAVSFPLAKGVGFALSVTPVSSVGYRTYIEERDPDIITDLGHVTYDYTGEGGLAQYKAGVGVKMSERLSLGADLVLYHGNIDRTYSSTITPLLTNESVNNMMVVNNERLTKLLFIGGVQYDLVHNPKRMLTLGATIQPEATISNRISKNISISGSTDSIYSKTVRQSLRVPMKITAGFYYQTAKFGFGADYSTQDWTGAFTIPAIDRMTLTRSNSYSVGMQYTPNAIEVHNRLNRWTYRAGFRYADYYLVKNGHAINETGVTVGLGIPLKMGYPSEVSVGLEVGTRGATDYGLVKDDYFRVSLGFTFFGDDSWFFKRKFF